MTKLNKWETNDLDKQVLLVEISRLRAEVDRLQRLVPEPELLVRLAKTSKYAATKTKSYGIYVDDALTAEAIADRIEREQEREAK